MPKCILIVVYHLQDIRLPCVTGILVPEGMNWKDVANYAMKTYVSKEVIYYVLFCLIL